MKLQNLKKAWFMLLELGLRVVIHPALRAKLLALCGATVGKNVRIYEIQLFNLSNGFKNLKIADDVHIGTGCRFDLEGEIYLGQGVTLSPGVTILTHSDPGQIHHAPLCKIFQPIVTQVHIEAHCWIGCNVTILAGTHIATTTAVGACSLVKGNLESYSLYVGVPARKIKTFVSLLPNRL
jgi:acetyltransferase-like isoleucine patch superfamily enzyme